MKKCLLVGSSYSAVPLLKLLKKRKLHVSVCGGNKLDPCHAMADASFFVDYSDSTQLKKLITEHSFDYIVPVCNDYSYLSCAWAISDMHFYGFDSFATSHILHSKEKYRAEINKIGLSSPQLFNIESETDLKNIKYPVLVKPIDSFSGRGITKVTCEEELTASLTSAKKSSRSSTAIVESFVEGKLYSHSAFLKDNDILWDCFVDEFCNAYEYQVDGSCHPSTLNTNIKVLVRESIKKFTTHFNLCDGLLHTQFIASNDSFYLIECMRRCPGDMYYYLVEKSTGVNYLDLYLKPFLNEPYDTVHTENEKFIIRHTISASTRIFPESFTLTYSTKNMTFVPLKSSSDILNPAPYDKMGILFIEVESCDDLKNITPEINKFVEINL